jgi:dTMP kinase
MFITLEGSEGSGKTSQMEPLVEHLRRAGYDVVATREPGGTSIGDQIREVLLTRLENTAMQQRTEILLFQAARAQLVDEVIRPALAAGKVVVSDRYADSTLAYQGYGYQRDLQELRRIVDFATGGLKPDLTLLFDVDVEVGLRRRRTASEWNRMDAYDLEFYRRVRQGYLEMAREEPQRWVIIEANRPPELVQADMLRAVSQRLNIKIATQKS